MLTLIQSCLRFSAILLLFTTTARAATWSTAPWTGDASSGISTDSEWAYHFGSTTPVTISGKSVAGIAGSSPAVANNFSIVGVDQVFTDDTNDLTTAGDSGSAVVANNFIWGGSPATVTLFGLVPGASYVASFLSVGWEAPGQRLINFSSGGDSTMVDQGQFGDNRGIRVDYDFTADGVSRTITLAPIAATPSYTFHIYGLALREYLPKTILGSPFTIRAPEQIRADYTINWSQAGPANGTVLPNDFYFAASDAGTPVTIHSDSPGPMTVITGNTGGATTGTLLSHPAPNELRIYPLRKLQGFGVSINSTASGPVTYTMIFLTITSQHLGTATAVSAGAGEPVFLGMIDPDARIEIIQVRSDSSQPNAFTLSNPVFQLPHKGTDDPNQLAAVARFRHKAQPATTYLHEGVGKPRPTPATTLATEVNPNVIDLLDSTRFPGLRGGDVLRLSVATASPGNPLMGLLSRTQVLLAGNVLNRVPGALKAGKGYPTPPVSGGFIATPTDLAADFVIGSSSFVEVPQSSRYLMLSLAQPSLLEASRDLSVEWIPRALYENWALARGMVGPLAALNADIDEDGLTNLEEFALGRDPTVPDAETSADFNFTLRPFAVRDASGNFALQMIFGARNAAPLSYRASFSTDLSHWQTGTPDQVVPLLFNADGSRAVFSVMSPPAAQSVFGRVVIDYLPPLTQ